MSPSQPPYNPAPTYSGHYATYMHYEIHNGDCLEVMRAMGESSVDAIVTDPPYGLSFMGKGWDHAVPGVEFWSEALRVAKPGAHMLAFGGTRLYHRLTCAIEDAGWEVRDCLMWLYGSGFSKGFNMRRVDTCKCGGNAIPYSHAESQTEHRVRPLRGADLQASINPDDERGEVLQPGLPEQGASRNGRAGAESEHCGETQSVLEGRELHRARQGLPDDSYARTPESEAERVCAGTHRCSGEDDRSSTEAGRGSPSQEQGQAGQQPGESGSLRGSPFALGQAPHGRNGCCPNCGKLRKDLAGFSTSLKPAYEPIILARKPLAGTVASNVLEHGTGAINVDGCRVGTETVRTHGVRNGTGNSLGLSTYESPDGYSGNEHAGRWPANLLLEDGTIDAEWTRYFYCPKASKADRDEGLEDLEPVQYQSGMGGAMPIDDDGKERDRFKAVGRNIHPTVKPTDLMRYLCRLVTPPGAKILDPFMGSGSTGKAATLEGFQFIGIDLDPNYCDIARRRIEHASAEAGLYTATA